MMNKFAENSVSVVPEESLKTARPLYETRYHRLKKYLHSLQRLDKKCSVLQYRISLLEEKAAEMGGLTDYDTCKLEELRGKNNILQSLLKKKQAEIGSLIDRMEIPMEKEILKERYLRYKSWDVIAADFGMRERQVQLLHGCALTALDELMSSLE